MLIAKKGATRPGVSLVDATEEALCFGWIDSAMRPLDEERYVLRYAATGEEQLVRGQQGAGGATDPGRPDGRGRPREDRRGEAERAGIGAPELRFNTRPNLPMKESHGFPAGARVSSAPARRGSARTGAARVESARPRPAHDPPRTLGAAAAVAIVAGQDPKAGAFVPLVVAIAVPGSPSRSCRDRMAGSAWGRQVLYVWAGLDLLLITLAAWSAAGVDAALPLGYGVTIVVFAVVFPIRGQAAFLAAMLACYTGVLLSTEFEFLPLAMLATLGAPACFLSREVRRRIDVDGERVAAERRWAVTSLVAATVRDRPDADPAAVLQGVEAVCRRDTRRRRSVVADAEPWVVLPADIDEAHAGPPRSVPESVRTAVLEEGMVVVAAGDDETDHAHPPRGGIPEATSPLRRHRRRPPGAHPPGRERRTGPDHPARTRRVRDVGGAGRARAGERGACGGRADGDRGAARRSNWRGGCRADPLELVTQLSDEVRRPLGIVTDAARALRERMTRRSATGSSHAWWRARARWTSR